MYREIIMSKIVEYLKFKKWDVKKAGKVIMMKCIYCEKEPMTANVIPNTSIINCLHCNKKYDLTEVVTKLEGREFENDEKILEYLKGILNIEVTTKAEEDEIEKILSFYSSQNFAVVPLAKKDKNPIQSDWTNKENRNVDEWAQWIANGLNLGIRTGEVSNLTVLDVDCLSKPEQVELIKIDTSEARKKELKNKKFIPETLKNLMGNGLIQETFGGFHLLYKYEDTLTKGTIVVEGVNIDVENDGGQVVVSPAPEVAIKESYIDAGGKNKKRIVGYGSRKFINENKIIKMPEELLKYVQEHQKKTKKTIDIPKESVIANLDDFAIKDLDGICNSSFVKMGGILLKKLTVNQTEFVLHVLNRNLLEDPMEDRAISSMCHSLSKYEDFDLQDLEDQVIDYLQKSEGASKAEIEIAVLGKRATGEEKKRIDELLVGLIKKELIIPKGRQYKFISQMDWSDTITDVGRPIDFKVPYFHDYARFNWGDMILVGAKTKFGKTSLSMNFVKRLVDQGIKPRYLYTESGGRFQKSALQLGMKDKDFWRCYVDDADEIQIPKGGIVIWDWIDPPNFAETNVLFGKIVKKIEKAQAFLIGFVQLKDDKDSSWFAPNMIRQRPCLACKYLYEDEDDGKNTYFHITEVREPKMRGKSYKIPCTYKWETNEVIRVDELKKNQQKELKS